MKNVNRYTRAGRNGKEITCPKCKESAPVFHFSWSALTCQFCSSDINKEDWLIITQSPNLSEVSDFFLFEIAAPDINNCTTISKTKCQQPTKN